MVPLPTVQEPTTVQLLMTRVEDVEDDDKAAQVSIDTAKVDDPKPEEGSEDGVVMVQTNMRMIRRNFRDRLHALLQGLQQELRGHVTNTMQPHVLRRLDHILASVSALLGMLEELDGTTSGLDTDAPPAAMHFNAMIVTYMDDAVVALENTEPEHDILDVVMDTATVLHDYAVGAGDTRRRRTARRSGSAEDSLTGSYYHQCPKGSRGHTCSTSRPRGTWTSTTMSSGRLSATWCRKPSPWPPNSGFCSYYWAVIYPSHGRRLALTLCADSLDGQYGVICKCGSTRHSKLQTSCLMSHLESMMLFAPSPTCLRQC